MARMLSGVELIGDLFELGEVGELVFVSWDLDEGDRGVGFFELRRNDVARASGSEGEGDEGWWDVNLVEGSRHGVLATDGSETEFVLGFEGSEKGGEGESPAGGVVAELGEVFL